MPQVACRGMHSTLFKSHISVLKVFVLDGAYEKATRVHSRQPRDSGLSPLQGETRQGVRPARR